MEQNIPQILRDGVGALETFYRLWEEKLFGSEAKREISKDIYRNYDRIVESLDKAAADNRLLLSSPKALHIALLWTHGECCAVALCLHHWLSQRGIESELWSAGEREFHAFLKVGDYWCDGLLWSTDINDIYRAENGPELVELDDWHDALFYNDLLGMVRTSQWLELVGTDSSHITAFEFGELCADYHTQEYSSKIYLAREHVKTYIADKCVAIEAALATKETQP